jgi:hypothetical protein
MRYFAHVQPPLDIDQVVCVADSDVGNLTYPESEPLGQAFLHALYGTNDQWLETSMTGAYRGQPATIGGAYDPTTDTFTPPPTPEPDPEEE